MRERGRRKAGVAASRQHFPVPAGSTSAFLDQISCTSAQFCEAVGSYNTSAGKVLALAVQWNGTAWRLQRIPDPSTGTIVRMNALSCVSPGFCEAGGSSAGFSSSLLFAEQWNGTSWHLQALPGTAGSTWTAQPTAGDPGESPNAVSCSAADSCEAVGNIGAMTFAEAWNGSTWTLQSTPSPSGFELNVLSSVSCTSADACTAVGQSETSGQAFSSTLGEVWNGTAWTLRSTPNKPTAGSNILNGVSCGTSQRCTAVGDTQDVGGTSATLVEIGD